MEWREGKTACTVQKDTNTTFVTVIAVLVEGVIAKVTITTYYSTTRMSFESCGARFADLPVLPIGIYNSCIAEDVELDQYR